MVNLLSVDVGTTALKISLVRTDGRIIDTAVAGYETCTENTHIEQNPEDWWHAFLHGIEQLKAQFLQSPPDAIVLSGQMQDLICITNGKLSGNAILYSDSRAQDEWSRIEKEFGHQYFFNVMKNQVGASCLPAKILWLKKNKPDDINASTVFLSGAHDYICWKLTGLTVTDFTNASTTGLLDFEANDWDKSVLSILGITFDNMPELVRADSVTGSITPDAALWTGLSAGLPVIHGAGDAGSSTVGAGAGVSGNLSCYLGTSGWISTTTDLCMDSCTGIFNLKHPDPGKVINIGAMMLTGGNVEWCVKNFFDGNDFKEFSGAAESAAPGSGGVFYLPYLSGERSPFLDPKARGAFVGLTGNCGKPEIARAVLEGVSYSLKAIVDTMLKGQNDRLKINLSGGGAENKLWVQIISSVLNAEVSVLSNARESGILGNVIIAGKALGLWPSFEAPAVFTETAGSYQPLSEQRTFYKKGYEIFRNLYPLLRNSFSEISSLNLY